jgi:hypothetical protein
MIMSYHGKLRIENCQQKCKELAKRQLVCGESICKVLCQGVKPILSKSQVIQLGPQTNQGKRYRNVGQGNCILMPFITPNGTAIEGVCVTGEAIRLTVPVVSKERVLVASRYGAIFAITATEKS